MAVKASASITIWDVVDIESVTWYYKLQSSTAAAPSKPTTATPSGWTTTEPTYTAGSTNTLYVTCKVLFSDGTFAYADVSKSSSYEAAKAAYNKAQNAQDTANGTKQYFWHDSTGAHVSTSPNSASSGKNTLVDSNGLSVRNGNTVLSKFTEDLISLGMNSEEAQIKMCGDKLTIVYDQTSGKLQLRPKHHVENGVEQLGFEELDISLITYGSNSGDALYGLFLQGDGKHYIEGNLDIMNVQKTAKLTVNNKEVMTKDAVIREDITLKGTGYNFQYIALKSGYELVDAKTHATGTSNTILGIQYNPTSKVYAVIFNNSVSTSTTITVRCTWLKVE